MAAKRRMYHPAPTLIVADQKSRKQLVQGRLVTDTSPFNDIHLNQGLDESPEDLSIQPVDSLPILTENMSPRPERLPCLDLSDTDVDIADTSHSNRPKPVIVFDASKYSPHGAELDVKVEYEDSPARVICHNPAKLERSFLEERRAMNRSSGDSPNWHVRVDRLKNVSDFSQRFEKLNQSHLLNDMETVIAASNRPYYTSSHTSHRIGSSDPSGDYISQKNRGIIAEILAQELGSSNVEAISLHSETSPLSSHFLTPFSGTPQHKSETRFSESPPLSYKSYLQADNSIKLGSSQNRQKKKNENLTNRTPSSFPQPIFDDVSDASADIVPVKEAALTGDQESDSDTYSLREYVTPKKSTNKQVEFDKKGAVSSQDGQNSNQIETSQSVKKKTMRKVQSRYMLAQTNNSILMPSKNINTEPHLFKSNLKSHTFGAASNRYLQEKQNFDVKKSRTFSTASMKHSREKQSAEVRTDVRLKKSLKGKTHRNTNTLPAKPTSIQTQHPVMIMPMQSFARSDSPQEAVRSEFPNKQHKTSTPTHDQTCHLSQEIDASAIHSMSTMSINTSVINYPRGMSNMEKGDGHHITSEKTSNRKIINRPTIDHMVTNTADGSPISQLQLDLLYSRYIQWAFLNSKAKKALQTQEQDALSQINSLWQLVMSTREECTQLKMDVTRLKRLNLLDSILDKMEPDLESLTSLIPHLEEDYSRLGLALDTTRHQLPTKDIYIPPAQKDVYEEKLDAELTESEHILAEISNLISEKSLPLSQYMNSIEDIDTNVSAICEELQTSQQDVANLHRLTTRLTSLCVQDMQIQ